jgi:hypothetical protein
MDGGSIKVISVNQMDGGSIKVISVNQMDGGSIKVISVIYFLHPFGSLI